MKSFTEWSERENVQRVVAQSPLRQNLALLERLDDEKMRWWYTRQTLRQQQTSADTLDQDHSR